MTARTLDLDQRVRCLLAAGVEPADLAKARTRLGLAAAPVQVVLALERATSRLPGLDPPRGPAGADPGPGGPSPADAPGTMRGPHGMTHDDRLLVAGESLPARLEQTWAAGGPLWLHQRGLPFLAGPHVAVVGTRRATLDGLQIAERLGAHLARAGVTVVSGMARGIDQAAHRGALAAGGRTVAVLGTGLDVDYPAGSDALRTAVTGSGCLVSEYPHDHGIRHPTQFLTRNRILVGLSDVVVVVQAGARSGALNSASWATSFNRDVLVVPFSPSDRTAVGSLELLADGATPVRDARDVLVHLGVAPAGALSGAPGGEPTQPSEPRLPGIGDAAARVLPLLGSTPASPSALATATDLNPREVLVGLSELEEAGLARRTPGGITRRT